MIVFATQREPRGLRVLRADGVEEGNLPGVPDWTMFAFSPDWRHIAYVAADRTSWGYQLVVARPDGSERRVVAAAAGVWGLAWSPDGARVAFVRTRDVSGATIPDLYTIDVDGSGPRRVAERASNPEFAPDGTRVAFLAGHGSPPRPGIVVATLDGSASWTVAALETGPSTRPRWSPDGTRIAVVDGRFAFEWSRDGRSLLVSGIGVYRLSLKSGRAVQLSPFGDGATSSPDGSTIAFVGGGECKDRLGLYLVPAAGGARTRLTNDCRIRGTEGPDSLVGTVFADVLLGRGGDDRLTANDAYYVGDDLYGGPGDDVLNGHIRGDLLDRGPGRDRVSGASGPDTVRGGPGVDVLAGDGGKDMLFAEDGQPDRVSCGTNRPGNGRDLDTAFLDRRDRVAGDCELLYRDGRANLASGRTRLAIVVWDRPGARAPYRRWTLRCNPAGGTLAGAASACRRLSTMWAPLAPIATGATCLWTPPVAGRRAQVGGLFAGRRVTVFFSRYNDCEVARWARHAFLFQDA